MDRTLLRAYVVELIGTFGLVFFGAAVVCVNYMTTPSGQQPGSATLIAFQPGLVGIALAQGLILAVLLSITVPVSGGYLNPAVALMLWVFNRLDSRRASWLIGAQILGSVLAALCVSYTFGAPVLQDARLGTPHLNPAVFLHDAPVLARAALVTGTGMELVLTFFVVFAILGINFDGSRQRLAGLGAGLAWTAALLVGFPLTGAATNPARWFGPALMEFSLSAAPAGMPPAFADAFVYIAGPTVGALLAGLVCFKVMASAPDETAPAPKITETGRQGSAAYRARK